MLHEERSRIYGEYYRRMVLDRERRTKSGTPSQPNIGDLYLELGRSDAGVSLQEFERTITHMYTLTSLWHENSD